MPLAIDTVAGAAASGTVANAIVPFVPGVGDTFTVRNYAPSSTAQLEMLCGHYLQSNPLRVRSPMLHDNTQGIRVDALAGDTINLLPTVAAENLIAQDTLAVELVVATAPGVTETEVAALGIYYADLQGASARLHLPGDITPNIKHVWSVPVTIAPNAVAGAWASGLITSTYDLFQANTDYAVLGYEVDTACAAIAVRGADTSNLRVGGPGITDRYKTRQHFADMSMARQTPHIPVINSANKNATFVDAVSRLTAGNITVTLILAELSQNLP